uniref:Uncharacterized protein n=1 Tax=Oryzias latipes TaxID=8090 RepID=A0A3P9JHL4_ORYLA
MELPFTSFELTFIIIAFLVFSLFGLASVCIEPRYGRPGTQMSSAVRNKTTNMVFNDDAYS